MASPRVIGVDLGGTKILAGVVDEAGAVTARREHRTPVGSQAELLTAIDGAVDDLLGEGVGALGIGVPSTIDQRTGRVEGSVNIPLADVDLRGRMTERFGLPVAIENDANAAAIAEFRAGAGREARTMVMLTLGTGCGGGVVLDGALFRGWAELGHIVIDVDGVPCQGACAGRGHLEPYVTGLAATKLAREAFGPAADSHRLVRLANEGESVAQGILRSIGEKLGAGIASLVNVFNPELVVIGGGFAAAGEWLLEPAREIVRWQALAPAGERVRIVRAELGTAAGLIGAAFVGFEALAAASRP
ncbi:MAG: ROK family protein [Actinomycetota bacterium]|nr:ROK family protein [Actinomycetota bacterium]